MHKRDIGIGILGFGTVGAGVVEGLTAHRELLAQRTGLRLVLRRIADIDLERDRGVPVEPGVLTSDALSVVEDPDIDIVVELIGGTGIAKSLMCKALSLGKPVVTANKALLAECGEEIYRAAADAGSDLFFEASVGGGIPIIRSLREGLIGNRILRIFGILNGTCNYILTRMEDDGLPFDQVLDEAQRAGYAEAEPSLDIDGLDTAHKAVVLASQAFGRLVHMDDLRIEGIRGIDAMDIELAAGLGYRIKLLAVIKETPDGVDVRVHPALIPQHHMLASVHGVFNAVQVIGDVVGETLYYGRGAGRAPTASAVIGDIVDAARNIAWRAQRRIPAFTPQTETIPLCAADEVQTRYYLRLSLRDAPGMLGHVAHVLGDHGISIASVMQKEVQSGEYVPVIILTHAGSEGAFRSALSHIDALPDVGAPTVRYRIEDFA